MRLAGFPVYADSVNFKNLTDRYDIQKKLHQTPKETSLVVNAGERRNHYAYMLMPPQQNVSTELEVISP